MSSDNFYVVRRGPDHRFYPLMGFASDLTKPVIDPGRNATGFATPELALASVINDYTEYGHSIDPECYLLSDEFVAREESRAQLAETFADVLRYLLEEEPLEVVAGYLARIAEEHHAEAIW